MNVASVAAARAGVVATIDGIGHGIERVLERRPLPGVCRARCRRDARSPRPWTGSSSWSRPARLSSSSLLRVRVGAFGAALCVLAGLCMVAGLAVDLDSTAAKAAHGRRRRALRPRRAPHVRLDARPRRAAAREGGADGSRAALVARARGAPRARLRARSSSSTRATTSGRTSRPSRSGRGRRPGRSRTGAARTASSPASREADLVLDVSLRLRALLRRAGVSVVMTRTRPRGRAWATSPGRGSRTGRAPRSSSASTPTAHPSRAVRGTHTLVPALRTGLDGRRLPRRAGAPPRSSSRSSSARSASPTAGSPEHTDFTGFNWADVPVILVELGFMTNPVEDRALATGVCASARRARALPRHAARARARAVALRGLDRPKDLG